MKKFNFKNYIAFTLTEMTIVLLIMSVLAAASAPIITKSISDSNEKIYKSGPSQLWNKFSEISGIYSTNDTVSIGMIPSNANTVYNNAALAILSGSGSYASLLKYPQIISLYKSSGGSFDKSSLGLISMDAFGSLALTTHSFNPAFYRNSNINVGHGGGNVFIGSEMLKKEDSAQNITNNSIYLGTRLEPYASHNSIYVGHKLESEQEDYNAVVIGNNIYQTSGSAALLNPIFIGNYAGYATNSAYNIKIGTYAGTAKYFIFPAGLMFSDFKNTQNRSINIGIYSGLNSELYAQDTISIGSHTGQLSGDNDINIGTYAGLRQSAMNDSSVVKHDNISIGYSAGFKGVQHLNKPDSNNISIGYGASSGGAYRNFTISIGDNVLKGKTAEGTIAIGHYAGYASNDSIFIGSYAGGYGSTTVNLTYSNMIVMGYYAGTSTYLGLDSILIGPYAGYGGVDSSNSPIPMMSHKNSIALGYASCEAKNNIEYTNTNKTCIGMGAPTKKYSIYERYWIAGKAQTIIGNLFYAMNKNYITFYASTTYAPTTNVTGVSDKRLKENIVPSNRSLKEIRKVNIYNFNFKDEKEKLKIGVIAQEYKNIFPNGVVLSPETKYFAVKPEWLLFSAVNAVKELDKTTQNLEISLKNYINDFLGLKSRVAKLEKQASQLQQQNAHIKARLNKLK